MCKKIVVLAVALLSLMADGTVKLFVLDTRLASKRGLTGATTAQVSADENVQNGDRTRDLQFVVPMGKDHRFFKVKRNRLEGLTK